MMYGNKGHNKWVYGLLILIVAGSVGYLLAMKETPGRSTGSAEAGRGPENAEETPERSNYEGRVEAPDFPEGLEWVNVEKPVRMADLRGKVVLLDFWTYCCINCIHVIADLKRLERDFPDELVVVGVHSGKFTGEKVSENIRQAVGRYEIEHPVVNDNEMVLWQRYGVRAWPTLALVDPTGKVVGVRSGEIDYPSFKQFIGEMIKVFDERGQIDRTAAKVALQGEAHGTNGLRYPGKVLADEASGRLFISDSNHNRIVVVSLAEGDVTAVIGSGEIGSQNGDFETARFDHPQGMALAGETLYVADTENHAIRQVDLSAKTVTTVAGTGAQAKAFNISGPGLTTALNSPWDLLVHEATLYIAMAGPHQLWQMDMASFEVKPFAGSGREARLDGPLLRAALAQPSGLAGDEEKVYFADSEISAIRSAEFKASGSVETIVGGDLFDFGDVDGKGLAARLQHPLGVAYADGGILYVADTYNNKIKRVVLKDRAIAGFAGSGKAGKSDGPASAATFDEPAGLSLAGGKLYVADTNNHAIRIVDLKSKQVSTLQIKWGAARSQ